MADTINIHDEVFALCERLGLEPTNVTRLDITPADVTAVVCRVDENGSKYIEDDEVARDVFMFKVQT